MLCRNGLPPTHRVVVAETLYIQLSPPPFKNAVTSLPPLPFVVAPIPIPIVLAHPSTDSVLQYLKYFPRVSLIVLWLCWRAQSSNHIRLL